MSNSSLVSYTRISPNRTIPRRGTIKNIVIHHMAGNLTVETCGNVFAPSSRQASSNYGIGSDGRIAMYVEEKDRAWTTGNQIDHSSVTIEVADDKIGAPWHSSAKAMDSLVKLCADICKRNGIKKLNYTGDKSGNLLMHKWYQNTDCPGQWLGSQFPWIASEVNKILSGQSTKKATPTQKAGNAAYSDNRINYRVHMQKVGWLPVVRDGQCAGITGNSMRVEALKIDCKLDGVKIKAKAHIQGDGTVDYGYITSDTVIGTTGKSKRLEGIELTAEGLPDGKKLYIRTHCQTVGWSGWVECLGGTFGIGKRLEAIQIKIA